MVAVLWEDVTACRGAVDSSLRVKEDDVIKGTGTDRVCSSDVVERGGGVVERGPQTTLTLVEASRPGTSKR